MIKEIAIEGLEYIYHKGELYCLILRDTFQNNSVSFFTPDSLSQQLGYLPHNKGAIIKPHRHNINKREILYTQEVLFIKKGSIKVNLYDSNHVHIGSEILGAGDCILLCAGGQGFEMLEDRIMIEVKQGPYVGLDDKVRFEGVEGNDDTCK